MVGTIVSEEKFNQFMCKLHTDPRIANAFASDPGGVIKSELGLDLDSNTVTQLQQTIKQFSEDMNNIVRSDPNIGLATDKQNNNYMCGSPALCTE